MTEQVTEHNIQEQVKSLIEKWLQNQNKIKPRTQLKNEEGEMSD